MCEYLVSWGFPVIMTFDRVLHRQTAGGDGGQVTERGKSGLFCSCQHHWGIFVLAMHRRCSEEHSMLRLHNCCFQNAPLPFVRSSAPILLHLTQKSFSSFLRCVHRKIAASTNLCWGSLHHLAVINQSITPLLLMKSWALAELLPHESSMRAVSGMRDAGCFFHFFFFCFSSALPCWFGSCAGTKSNWL